MRRASQSLSQDRAHATKACLHYSISPFLEQCCLLLLSFRAYKEKGTRPGGARRRQASGARVRVWTGNVNHTVVSDGGHQGKVLENIMINDESD